MLTPPTLLRGIMPVRMTGSAVSAVAACAVAEKGEHACRRGGRGRGSGRGESSLIAPPTSRPFKACRAVSDLRSPSRRTRCSTCRKKRTTSRTWRSRRPMSDVRRRGASPGCRRCRGRHVGRGVRVGPCRTCDGVGCGPAVGSVGPTRRTWRPRRPMSDVRRRRRGLGRRKCRADLARLAATRRVRRAPVELCRTCDGVGGGLAVGGVGAARRAASGFARAAEKQVSNRQGRT